jgi:hypothetical protein
MLAACSAALFAAAAVSLMAMRASRAAAAPMGLTDAARAYLVAAPSRRGAPRSFVTAGTVEAVGSFVASTAHSNSRRDAVRDATRGAWDAYERHAWGFDEVSAISLQGTDTFAAGLGTTIVDSLSTLYIMGGLDGRYQRARDWVDRELDFDKVGRVIVFETVIRILGGLVSMYHLSGDEMYMAKAEELGVRLSVAFETAHSLPWPRCYLNETGRCEGHSENGDTLYLAEVGTVQLEYRALAAHSRAEVIQRMRAVTEEIVVSLQEAESSTGRLGGRHHALLPFALSISRGTFSTNVVTLGAPADSYFEYLVKAWVQGGRRERQYWEVFAQIADAMVEVFAYTSARGDVVLRDVYPDGGGKVKFSARQDHFTCFVPGALVLGLDGIDVSAPGGAARRASWELLAAQVAETCHKMYSKSPSGLAGEHVRLGSGDVWRQNGAYKLRPEAVEAFFYMYRHTREERYREWAWEVFVAMRRWCLAEGGAGGAGGAFAPLKNARSRRPVREDEAQPSFLIAETFKYLYLIFGEDEAELPLSRWVFNTEAHPLLVTPGLVSEESLRRLSRMKIVRDAAAAGAAGEGVCAAAERGEGRCERKV